MVDSFNFNCHKWLLVNFDCSILWVKNAKHLVEAFNVERIYLQHKHEGLTPELRHWQIPLGRRFRALKLWFVVRTYGVEGLRRHVRHQVALAGRFERLVRSDERFEVCTGNMGLVCFRLKGPDALTERLLEALTNRKEVYVIPCHYRGRYVIRFVVCSRVTEERDVDFAWEEIRGRANELLKMEQADVVGCRMLDTVIEGKKALNGGILGARCEKAETEKSK